MREESVPCFPLWLADGHFTFTWHSPCVWVCLQIARFHKDSRLGLGPTLMASFSLDNFCKDPICRKGHILEAWGLRLGHINGRGDTIQYLTAPTLQPHSIMSSTKRSMNMDLSASWALSKIQVQSYQVAFLKASAHSESWKKERCLARLHPDSPTHVGKIWIRKGRVWFPGWRETWNGEWIGKSAFTRELFLTHSWVMRSVADRLTSERVSGNLT